MGFIGLYDTNFYREKRICYTARFPPLHIVTTAELLTLILLYVFDSLRTVALRKKLVDRPESYSAIHSYLHIFTLTGEYPTADEKVYLLGEI